MPRIVDIISYLENFAPLAYQESYDNCGLLVGDKNEACTGVLVCLDIIEDIIDEAISKKCNLIVAHHPVIFSGLKKLTGANYVERIIIKAIQHNIAIYAIHTNLDNLEHGVSGMLAQKIGLKNVRVLAPKKGILSKLVTYIPVLETDKVLKGIFETGAGSIGQYNECSFIVQGTGSFQPMKGTKPYMGEIGKQEKVLENRVEIIYPNHLESKVVAALQAHHPYEEPAFDLISLLNQYAQVGSGCIGDLEKPMQPRDFLAYISKKLELSCVRFTTAYTGEIKKVALCGGSGSFLLKNAISSQADVLITGDFKYHDFFDADNKIIIADIGHYESEQFTQQLMYDIIMKKFPTFAIRLTEINTNPVKYFI